MMRAASVALAIVMVWMVAAGCGSGEITQQDQYNKAKQLEKQGAKDPGQGEVEK